MQLRASATDGRIQRALLIAVAVVCVISMGSSAAASESQVPTEGGVATLQDCFVQKKRLMAVVLVDESASLKGYGVRAATDPDNERVGALDSVLDTLSQLVTTGGTSLDVDVLVAGFGEEYLPATDWVTVNETDTPELAGVAEGFRDRNKAIDTDYVLALQGAQDALDQRAAATSAAGEACRLMVILSDGEYSLGTRTDRKPYAESVSLTSLKGQREAVQIGLKELCRPGGLADQLRSTETVTLGMGLQLKKDIHPDAELENVAPVDFFNALAMGQGGGFSCGNPDSGKFGAVVTADDFGEIVIKICCMIQHCGLSDPLTVDRTVESIVVQTVLATPDGKLEVTDPTGRVEAVPLSKETSFSVLGGQARVRPQSAKLATLTIDFDQAGDAQVGQWTLAAAKDSGVGLVAAVNSNLSLELPDGQEWTIGQPGRVTGQFIVGDGLPITLAEVAGTVDVDGRVVVPGQSSEMSSTSAGPNADGTVELTVPAVPDLEQAAVTAEFTVTGAFPPVGTPPTEVLRPDGRATTSVLLRSEGFRVLDVPPGGLRLSGVSGGSDGEPIARGTLKALAGNEGGEICLKSVQMSEVPEDAVVDGLEPSTCSELTAGKPAEVDVGIVVDDVRSGEYDGFLQIELRSSSEEGVRRVQVPISFAGSEATCQAVAILILVGIVMGVMLLGLLAVSYTHLTLPTSDLV